MNYANNTLNFIFIIIFVFIFIDYSLIIGKLNTFPAKYQNY